MMDVSRADLPQGAIPDRRTLVLFFLVHLLAYAYFVHMGDWNSHSRFGLTLALVEQGSVSIDRYHDQPGWKTSDKSFANGHYYSDKAPGMSFLGAVVYWPVYQLTTWMGLVLSPTAIKFLLNTMALAIPAALGSVLMFIHAWQLSRHLWLAFLAGTGITLGTMFWPYSSTYYGHVLSAVCLFAAYFLLRSAGMAERPWRAIAAGVLLGWSFITEYTTALIIACLLLCGVFRFQRLQPVIWVGLGALGPLLLALLYNQAAFGSPFSTGYAYAYLPVFRDAMSDGLMGINLPNWRSLVFMTIHPSQGIFIMSPVLLLVLTGGWAGMRGNQRPDTILASGIFLLYALAISGYYMWWGGWAFAPRHLIPALPFLSILLAQNKPKFLPVFWLLWIVSCVFMFMVASTTISVPDDWVQTLMVSRPFQFSTLFHVIFPRFFEFSFGQNGFNLLFANSRSISVLPFVLVQGFLGFFLVRAIQSSGGVSGVPK